MKNKNFKKSNLIVLSGITFFVISILIAILIFSIISDVKNVSRLPEIPESTKEHTSNTDFSVPQAKTNSNEIYSNDAFMLEEKKYSVEKDKDTMLLSLYLDESDNKKKLFSYELDNWVTSRILMDNVKGDQSKELIIETKTTSGELYYEYHVFEIENDILHHKNSINSGFKPIVIQNLDSDSDKEIIVYDTETFSYDYDNLMNSVYPMRVYVFYADEVILANTTYTSYIHSFIDNQKRNVIKLENKGLTCKSPKLQAYIAVVYAEYYFLDEESKGASYFKAQCGSYQDAEFNIAKLRQKSFNSRNQHIKITREKIETYN